MTTKTEAANTPAVEETFEDVSADLTAMFGKEGIYNPTRLELARKAALKAVGGDEGTLALIRKEIEAKASRKAAKIANLNVSLQAQRHSGHKDTEAAIKAAIRIIKDFDINAFETTSIATRSDDERAIVDGGHRALIAALVGAKVIPADVWNSTGEQYEAGVFVKMNSGRRGVSSVIKVRTQALNLPSSVQAQTVEAIKAAGLEPDTDTFKGLNALVSVMRSLSKEMEAVEAQAVITDALSLYTDIWAGSIEQDVAAALAYIVADTDMDDEQKVVFARNVSNQFSVVAELMEHIKQVRADQAAEAAKTGGKTLAHAHGKGRVEALIPELLSFIPDDVDLEKARKAQAERRAEDAAFDGDEDEDGEGEGEGEDDAPVEALDGPTLMVHDFLKGMPGGWDAAQIRQSLVAEGTKVSEKAVTASLQRLAEAKLIIVEGDRYVHPDAPVPEKPRKSRTKAPAAAG